MIKRYALLLLLPVFFVLGGCATNARPGKMTFFMPATRHPHNKTLLHNINVVSVSGGHETNPLWTSQIDNKGFKEALINSLSYAKLYQGSSNARYQLSAELLKLKQPFIGFDMTVKSDIKYSLFDKQRHRVVLNKEVNAAFTGTIHDAFSGVARLRFANEGSARHNIKALMNSLYAMR